jgi:Spy/CpxP family protein refolding chaperone
MKRTLMPVALLLIAGTLTAAQPQRRQGPPPQNGPENGEQQRAQGPRHELLTPGELAEFLDLTDAQKQQIEALRETMRTMIEPIREQMRANHEQLEAAVDANNAQRAGELLIANRALHAQVEAAHATFAAGFEALLTSEQKAKWAVLQELREIKRD